MSGPASESVFGLPCTNSRITRNWACHPFINGPGGPPFMVGFPPIIKHPALQFPYQFDIDRSSLHISRRQKEELCPVRKRRPRLTVRTPSTQPTPGMIKILGPPYLTKRTHLPHAPQHLNVQNKPNRTQNRKRSPDPGLRRSETVNKTQKRRNEPACAMPHNDFKNRSNPLSRVVERSRDTSDNENRLPSSVGKVCFRPASQKRRRFE